MAVDLTDNAAEGAGQGAVVSVIVIVYNDAARLPGAVDSALEQSLRDVEVIIVDDASTDATPRVAEDLAAEHPGRIRVIRLATNSGGCGRPRNAGIEAARGRYVMFLDSDDTLDRDACRILVDAAEQTGADVASGRCVRVFLDRDTERVWRADLYTTRAVVADISECPDLLYDSLCTNKCYRRDFLEREGLRFTDGLHYEDLLFSAQVYAAARPIVIVPHRVYNWMVNRSSTRSITNRRAELRNFADRLVIHRRIDAALRARGAVELARHAQIKFVNHDLILYLRELRARDADYRRNFLDLAAGHLADLDEAVLADCEQIRGIAALMIARRDLDAAMAAADFAPKKGGTPVLSTRLVERDGRVYWCDHHLDTPTARRILDVTDLGLDAAPLGSVRLGGRVTAWWWERRTLHLAGEAVNPLGRITPETRLSGTLEIRDRRRPTRAFRVPISLRHDGDSLAWQATFRPARTIRPIGLVDQTWGLWLQLHIDDQAVTVRLTGDGPEHEALSLPVRPRLTHLTGDHMDAYAAESGELALRVIARRWPGRTTLPALRRVAATTWGRRWWRRFVRAEKATRRRVRRQ